MNDLLKLKHTKVYPTLAVQDVDVASAGFTKHITGSVMGLADEQNFFLFQTKLL